MNNKPILNITWAKAFGEVYCHHASLFIPHTSSSLFAPEVVCVGATIRTTIIEKGKVQSSSDKPIAYYLPCKSVEGGLEVPINSATLIECIGLNSWTSLKNGARGALKEFPLNLFYQLEEYPMVTLPFEHENNGTPYLLHEDKIEQLKDGEKIDLTITFNL